VSMRRRKKGRQRPLFVASTAAQSPGHRFYEAFERLLRKAEFDEFVEGICAEHYAAEGVGRPSIAPGVYFRMLLVGYFEGLESERGICWRCADSLSLKRFLGFEIDEAVPEHSTLSRTRKRLPLSVYSQVFDFALAIVVQEGLLSGKVVGVDSTYLRADASMKSIIRRDSGEDYNAFLKRLAQEEGIEEPSAEDLRRMDRKRKGKKCSNKDWQSPTDPDARIARMKDGTTRLSHKAEHVVDMQVGAIVEADIVEATKADSTSISDSIETAEQRLQRLEADKQDAATHDTDDDDGSPPPATLGSSDDAKPTKHIKEVTGDKGYHKAQVIASLTRRGVRTYIPEPKYKGNKRRFTDKGGYCTRRAVYANRQRVARAKGKALLKRRGELIERSFAHTCETGGHRRTRLRGRDNIHKRYLIHVAGFNLSLVMRKLLGFGTPRGLADAAAYWWAALCALFCRIFVLCGYVRTVVTRCLTSSVGDSQHRPQSLLSARLAHPTLPT
jgi:transposase